MSARGAARKSRAKSADAAEGVAETLWICGQPWTIMRQPGVSVDNEVVSGACDRQARTIYLSEPGSETVGRCTLLHESLHAVIATVSNSCPDDEERLVQALETGLYSMLVDKRNGWFWADLLVK